MIVTPPQLAGVAFDEFFDESWRRSRRRRIASQLGMFGCKEVRYFPSVPYLRDCCSIVHFACHLRQTDPWRARSLLPQGFVYGGPVPVVEVLLWCVFHLIFPMDTFLLVHRPRFDGCRPSACSRRCWWWRAARRLLMPAYAETVVSRLLRPAVAARSRSCPARHPTPLSRQRRRNRCGGSLQTGTPPQDGPDGPGDRPLFLAAPSALMNSLSGRLPITFGTRRLRYSMKHLREMGRTYSRRVRFDFLLHRRVFPNLRSRSVLRARICARRTQASKDFVTVRACSRACQSPGQPAPLELCGSWDYCPV